MATWLPIIISAIASVLAAGVAAWSAVKVAKVNAESEEKKEEREEREQRRKEDDEDKEKRRKEEDEVHRKINERLDILERADKCLLRADIIRTYNRYMEKGYMPIYGEENLDEAFAVYEQLHGNGTIKDLVADLKKLPHEKPN